MPTGEAPRGRPPTSHERQSGQLWASYRDGPAPWDIDEPQPAVVRLAEAEAFAGPAPGPHPVRRAELVEPFAADARWQVVAIEPETLRTRFSDASPAWSATVRRGLD